jgi:alginate O-acetyltransferase complex protein AlgI
MLFSSTFFLCYFLPVFLLVYYLIRVEYRNSVIVIASIFFYMWGAPKFVFVIVGSIILDYYLSHLIFNAEGKRRKTIMVVSVCLNVSILLYFKYANFLIENFNVFLTSLGATQLKWTSIALPIGISFFTFHELSYIIDVYRGVNKPMKKITDYAVYILLFPQLIAGPIIRYKEIANQIIDRSHQETIDNRLTGFFRFVIGLAKKVLIANVLGEQADQIFRMSVGDMSTAQAWLGILCYSFQIYFDFSGYSDMAIGLARMMGILFPENFDNPYISRNITEFWRRWHISLSRWMRDYLYIPLGGNKVDRKWKLYFNLWLVFIISGFWHGAAWTFIIWGIFHGMFLIADRIFLLKVTDRIGKIPSILVTFLIVMIGWVFFRSNNLSYAFHFIGKMFSFGTNFGLSSLYDNPTFNIRLYVVLIIAILFSFSGALEPVHKLQNIVLFRYPGTTRAVAFTLISIFIFMVCVGSISTSSFNPFIYFRF